MSRQQLPLIQTTKNASTRFLSQHVSSETRNRKVSSKRNGGFSRSLSNLKSSVGKDDQIGLMVNVCSCSNTSASIIRTLIEKYGWVETKSKARCHLLWTDKAHASSYDPFYRMDRAYKEASDSRGRTNHFPDLDRFVLKAALTEHLRFLRNLFPVDFRFMPQEWSLPRQLHQFKESFNTSKTYILKPSAGCQGAGIVIAQSWEKVVSYLSESPRSEHVAQEYIVNPMLLDGYKFDLRTYVLLESVTPLRAYVFRDGLARLCTEKYEPPSAGNLDNVYVHLTNYHLNKNHQKFKHADTYDKMLYSSKRSIHVVLGQLNREVPSFSIEKFWNDVDEIVGKTLAALWPSIWSSYIRIFSDRKNPATECNNWNSSASPKRMEAFMFICSCEGRDEQFVNVYSRPSFKAKVLGHINNMEMVVTQDARNGWIRHAMGWSPRMVDGIVVLTPVLNNRPAEIPGNGKSRCFHILGFDIILDRQTKPWLLEVNSQPSFNVGSALDDYMKVALIEKSLFIMKFITASDVEKAKRLSKQHRLKRALESQLGLLRWRQRRARRMMLKSQFWERETLSRKKSELDDIQLEMKRTSKLLVQVEKNLKEFLKQMRQDQKDFITKGNNHELQRSFSPQSSECNSNTEEVAKGTSSALTRQLLVASSIRPRCPSGSNHRSALYRSFREGVLRRHTRNVRKQRPETSRINTPTAEMSSRHKLPKEFERIIESSHRASSESPLDEKEEDFPTNFQSLKFSKLEPFEQFPHLGICSSPILQYLYLECQNDKGLSSSKFVRVFKHYGIVSGESSRARASLTFIQNLRPPRHGSDSARDRKSQTRSMSFTDFCQTIVIVALKRYPGRQSMKAVTLLMKSIRSQFLKDCRDRATRRRVARTLQ